MSSAAVEALFDEDVIVEDVQNVTNETSETFQEPKDSNEELSDPEDLFGDGQDVHEATTISAFEQNEDNLSSEDEITTNFEVANFKQPSGDTGAIYLAKLPSFLDICDTAYDPDTLLAEIQQSTETTADNDEKMTKKRSLVNTLRWKHVIGEDGSEKRISNGRFVKWSDGSMSLQVGEELFDVPIKDITKEHSYLTLMHADEGLLRAMQRFSHSMTFQPYGLSSKSHAELKADIARRAISSKGRTVKLHTEMVDPADFQKQAIKADNEKQKARRRLDNQKARSMNSAHGSRDRTQLTARYLDDSDEELGSGRQRYADENDDGFIEDDEDEEAAYNDGGNRLQALKDAGAAEYRNKKAKRSGAASEDDESEDESIVYEDGAGEESEEEAKMTPKTGSVSPVEEVARPRKLKRRIAESDDDDN